MLQHRGYTGQVEFDDEARLFHGEVIDLRDVVTFQGRSVEELEEAFRDSVDDYLEFCELRGEEPDRPFSGGSCSGCRRNCIVRRTHAPDRRARA